MNFPLNLDLPCYYFEILLLSRDVNSPRRLLDVNKGAILNLSQYGGYSCNFKHCYNFEALLLLLAVNKR